MLKSFFNRGYQINKISNLDFLNRLLDSYISLNNNIKFIQIGANDGQRFDPIHSFVKRNKAHAKGFVLEPIKLYFDELEETYRNFANVIPINKAIHNDKKVMEMYIIFYIIVMV
mgnify:CR=1 FL=1